MTTKYKLNHKRHRDNEHYGKDLFWYKNNLLHRDDDLPAVITKSRVEWFVNGKRHREYGLPAVCNSICGKYEWWVNGSLHREDGPAVIEGMKQEFYLEHIQYPKNQFIKLIKQRNEEVKNALLQNTNICKDLCGLIANYAWFFDL